MQKTFPELFHTFPEDFPLQHSHTISSRTSVCAQEHCHTGTGLGHLVAVKGFIKVARYKDVTLCGSNFVATVREA